ncbi:glycosyltransferase family 15 protein [Backusella circina FSU 941]|nr:glycosyltransferase family 15 protein [Backusella circina FSU 941]
MDWVQTNSSKPRAAFVVITHEEEIFRLRATMVDLEERFNKNHNYPWIIISDKPLSRRFREWAISTTEAPVYFGQAPQIEWNEPYWIDVKRVEEGVKHKVNAEVKHGENISWRRMTRYAAGYLAYHPLLKDLEFYWKVQPGSLYSCDIPDDPFQQMKKDSKKFSFLLTMTENHLAAVGFENTIKQFIANNKRLIQPIKNKRRLGEYKGKLSNCHIWNNFMIVSLPFLRSNQYRILFEHVDNTGGFFYDRWSDSFLQTIAVSLFLNKKEISIADLAGYSYAEAGVCPAKFKIYKNLGCTCQPASYRGKLNLHFFNSTNIFDSI